MIVTCLASDIFYFWIKNNADKHPTIRTTNISTLTNSEVKTYVFDLNYCANANNEGAEMFEIKINCYTGINKDKIYSYGFQVINPRFITYSSEYLYSEGGFFWHNEYHKYVFDFSKCQVSYFNSDDFVSYNASTALNKNENPYVIDIEGKTVAFTFEKKYYETFCRNFVGIRHDIYYVSSFEYFAYKMYKSMLGLSTGENVQGLYENLNVNLNDVFALYDYNEGSKQFDKPIDFGYSSEYMGIRIKYLDRGATMHSDSMFNKIGSNGKGGVIYG